MGVTLLFDADITAYQMAFVNENLDEADPGLFIKVSDGNAACRQVKGHVLDMLEKLNADRAIMVLSDDKGNFRKKVCKTYKSTRAHQTRPLCLKFVREYIRNNFDVYELDDLEGDDCIGILATHPDLVPGKKIMVSIDKDMRTISGDIYNTRTGKMITVTEEEADYNHLMQTLTGDAVDNYIGCPGIGKVNAKKILDAADDKWAAIVKAYEKAGLTEEDALIQARCARILRHTDYDLEKKEVILWSP